MNSFISVEKTGRGVKSQTSLLVCLSTDTYQPPAVHYWAGWIKVAFRWVSRKALLIYFKLLLTAPVALQLLQLLCTAEVQNADVSTPCHRCKAQKDSGLTYSHRSVVTQNKNPNSDSLCQGSYLERAWAPKSHRHLIKYTKCSWEECLGDNTALELLHKPNRHFYIYSGDQINSPALFPMYSISNIAHLLSWI